MSAHTVFKAWFAVCVLTYLFVVRMPHMRRNRSKTIGQNRDSRFHSLLMNLHTVGWMLLPGVYICTGLLDFANYHLPAWAGWFGVLLVGAALALNWRAHLEMGSHWTPTLELEEDHSLVTDGVFRYIRHPIYASFWLWSAGQALSLQNWVAGLAGLALFLPVYVYRMNHEERMMLEQFGEEYRHYMERTGRVIPQLLRRTEGERS